jgi:hypothetical protein
MKKHLLILILLFTSNILYAGEIKLSCDINLTISYPSGREENKKVREIYEIDESTYISIFPVSNLEVLPHAISHKNNPINNSNQNKWDIQNKFTRGEFSYITSVIIDRNSGQIFTSIEATKKGFEALTTKGIGGCEKVDITKKKF